MATVAAIINAACRGLGFTPSTDEQTTCMEALNLMLQDWALMPGGVSRLTRENFTMVASTASYTIGASMTFNTTLLPIRIVKAFTRTDNVDYPIAPYYSMADYADIEQKADTGRPHAMVLERSTTTGTVLFYPTPDAAYAVHLWSHKPIAAYSSTSSDLALPSGYEPAIKWNLRVEIASEWGLPIAPQDAVRAEQTLSALKRLHSQPVPMISTDQICGGVKSFDVNVGF